MGELMYVRWPKEALQEADVPPDTKLYLESVGLPNVEDSSQRFRVLSSDAEGNLVIGNDYGEPIIVEKGTGHVFAIQALTGEDGVSVSRRRPLFVNSNVQMLGRFVELYEGFRGDSRVEAEPEYARAAFQQLEETMGELDPGALSPEAAGMEETMWRLPLNDIRWQL
jgi:hypothetical protein